MLFFPIPSLTDPAQLQRIRGLFDGVLPLFFLLCGTVPDLPHTTA